MNDEILKSGRDTLLVAIPLILLLFIGMFRLDELLIRPKKGSPDLKSPRRQRRDRPLFAADPDGTPLRPARRRK